MDDAAFREQFKPVHVPAGFDQAGNLQDKVVFALAEIGAGTADAVSRKLEALEPDIPEKEIIAKVHLVLTGLYKKGLIAGNEHNSGLVYNLHKITQANEGSVR
ncbi:hypothetical protein FO440_18280 [Mucilaginibacter corticis]|uniref:ArsR family transcriptional regulator n=1 Tax=Mucilaginibacter corticis TaxID=2597670 RepID=A0A556MIF3_9SPHI|nr:hypothetical protein [Mucilaginibacter corticis]TSJ39687.1 hypothetical protein FO440_18280 [Mucilaginibacter corticis]